MTQFKDKRITRSLVYLVVPILLSNQASAQLTIKEQPVNRWLNIEEEQFQQGQYKVAEQSGAIYLSLQDIDLHHINYTAVDKASYYKSVAALKTDDSFSVDNATRYLNSTANPAYKQRTAYAIAQHYFRQNEFARAIQYYEMAGIYNLSNREIADAKFELAYCYFNMKRFDQAEPLLQAIKEVDGKYYMPGNYYYGLLAYNQNDYKNALQSFERIQNEPQYKDIVPYYIAEIYYFMGQRDRALSEAKSLLQRPDKLYYDNELHLLAAQVLFEKHQYRDALPYFEYYYQHVDRIRKEDLYEMAYCYYDGKEWNKAIDKFKQLSNTQDSLAQTAMYLLGDCYLKTSDKKSARNAFGICADMRFNNGQREAALLLAAKLSYEMGYNDEALGRINDLLASYPNTEYKDEAKTIMSDLLIKTNNYVTAYDALQEVTHKNEAYDRVMQKVAFGYAMLQLQNGDYGKAEELLNESLIHSVDTRYELAADFWKGELAYKMHRFDDALVYTEKFISKYSQARRVEELSPAATLQNAYINMGYAAMEQKDFKAAQSYFNKVQLQPSDSATAVNAVLREADAVFMQKNYDRAIALYDKVIAVNGPDADYAKYQKALILGVLGRRAEESVILSALMSSKSGYAANARYEQGLIYIEDDKYQQAITTLQPLTDDKGDRRLAAKAWMKLGFAYQQMNNDDKAIEAYKHIVAEYAGSEERNGALDALKSLYIEHNQPDMYSALLKENNITGVDDNSLDSAYYSAAETQFAAGKWANARQAFNQYLEKYPNGTFVNKAHFYKAESDMQMGETKEALSEYKAVLNNSWSDFTERSAAKAANIAYQQKNYEDARLYYSILRSSALAKQNLQEAYAGLMRSSYELKKYSDATSFADTLSTLPDVDEQLTNEALLYKARALQADSNTDAAINIYKQLAGSKRSAIAAEADYYIAQGQYKEAKYKEAEETINNAIKLAGGDDKMVVKSYLLLADILVAEKDFFNAKALLQSIVRNSKVAEVKQQASDKLAEVKALENKNSKLKQD
ncbi:MAG: tetratricopeptide repeat protein [Bacteroidetes bacterium]|nr:tetratricopeptide repeat protein [Bacteroidota bacterium]